jgi:uncharacterized protein YaiE (UPF0345 family)
MKESDKRKIEQFKIAPPNLNILKRKHAILNALDGEYDLTKPNIYDCGVISWNIINTRDNIKATLGIIPEGNYKFNTGKNTEFMTPLDNGLEMAVNSSPVVLRLIGGVLEIPAGQDLIIKAKHGACMYLCTYNKTPDPEKVFKSYIRQHTNSK